MARPLGPAINILFGDIKQNVELVVLSESRLFLGFIEDDYILSNYTTVSFSRRTLFCGLSS